MFVHKDLCLLLIYFAFIIISTLRSCSNGRSSGLYEGNYPTCILWFGAPAKLGSNTIATPLNGLHGNRLFRPASQIFHPWFSFRRFVFLLIILIRVNKVFTFYHIIRVIVIILILLLILYCSSYLYNYPKRLIMI